MWRVIASFVFFACFSGSPAQSAIEDHEVPESQWIERERQIASAAVAGSEADYLVLPARGGESRFGPVESTLIAAVIATELELSGNVAVTDPTIARLALGKNRVDPGVADAASLAKRGGIERLVVPFAEYSEAGTFLLRLTVHDPATAEALSSKTWEAIPFDDETLPHIAIAEHLPAITEFILGRTPGAPDRLALRLGDDVRFPDSWTELRALAAKSPLHSAAYLQLLAMLHPGGRWNESRDALLIRSIAELRRVDVSSEGRAYLLARAYAYLDRRPAALEALGDPTSRYEVALREALDGNAVELRSLYADLGKGPMDFFVFRDALRLEEYYLGPFGEDQYGSLPLDDPKWGALIRRALHHSHAWQATAVADIEQAIDVWLPESQSRLAEVVSAVKSMTRAYTEVDAAADYLRRLDAYVDGHLGSEDLLPANSFGVRRHDIVDLAREVLLAVSIERIVQDRDRRGFPEKAEQEAERIMAVFPGHPETTLLVGETIRMSASRLEGPEARTVRERSFEHSRNGLMWTGVMSNRAVAAARSADELFPAPTRDPRRPTTSRSNPTPYRSLEWPRSHAWLDGHEGNMIMREEGLDYCLAQLWAAFGCIEMFATYAMGRGKDESEVRAIVAKGDGRFSGEPRRARFEVKLVETFGKDLSAWEKSMYAQADAGTSNWDVYYSLARHLRRQNRQDEALRVLLQYPRFSNYERRDALTVANEAGLVGSWFYWAGQTEQAVPLLEIAAAAQTGAALEYQALVRLAFIRGDLDAAFEYTYGRARRYESPYAMRDLMQLLHMRGESQPAWGIFDRYWETESWAQIWSGALVGHRRAGDDVDDIRSWLATIAEPQAPGAATPGYLAQIHRPARYLMLFAMLDRGPINELPAMLEELEARRFGPAYRGGNTTYYNGTLYRADPLLTSLTEDSPGFSTVNIPTPYRWRAEAMTAFLDEDYAKAREVFDELSFYYSLDEYLVYFVIAAAETKDTSMIRRALEARETVLAGLRSREMSNATITGQRFDEDLAYAVLAAYDGEHSRALDKLYEALNDRPFLNDRTIYPYYQLVDLAERLYRRTGYAGYKDFALDRARRHTIIQPMYAWAYFVVATHSTDAAERKRSARKGFELDPLSYRGTRLQPALRVRAAN